MVNIRLSWKELPATNISLLQKLANYGRKKFLTLAQVGNACYAHKPSILRKLVNYGLKKFYNIGPRCERVYRHSKFFIRSCKIYDKVKLKKTQFKVQATVFSCFSSSLTLPQNKLEHSSFKSFLAESSISE